MTFLFKEIIPLRVSILLLLLTSKFLLAESACQSCLLPVLPHRHHQSRSWHAVTAATHHPRWTMAATASSLVALKTLRKPLVQGSLVVAVAGLVTMTILRTSDETRDSADGTTENPEGTTTSNKKEQPPLSSAMVATIGVYKNFISPLLPPACRFLPTCSQYGVQAIEEFGPTKGAILTAWRLLRCSPFGGKGYDPPRWPPVKYTYGSY